MSIVVYDAILAESYQRCKSPPNILRILLALLTVFITAFPSISRAQCEYPFISESCVHEYTSFLETSLASVDFIWVKKYSKPITHPAHVSVLKRPSVHSISKLAGPYAQYVIRYADKARIPPKLLAAVMYVENNGNFEGASHRVSPSGAIGVMQLMPFTATHFLHVNPWSVKENIYGGAKYIHYLLRKFHGNEKKAVMAYNAGPYAVISHNIPYASVQYANEVMRVKIEL